MASDDERKALVVLLTLAAMLYLTVWILTEPQPSLRRVGPTCLPPRLHQRSLIVPHRGNQTLAFRRGQDK